MLPPSLAYKDEGVLMVREREREREKGEIWSVTEEVYAAMVR